MLAKLKYIFTLFFVLASFCLQAQLNSKVEHYSTEDGLCNNHVMCIAKCSDGFMWFGTWDGISRFDGRNFKTYTSRPGDSSRLKSTRIDNIVEDKSGYLWLRAYDNQIYRFDKKNGQFLAVSDLLAKAKVNNIVFDKIIATDTGQVWLSTYNQGVFHISNANSPNPSITRYSAEGAYDFSLPSNNINFFFRDADRNIWIGTDKGLSVLSPDKSSSFKRQKAQAGVPSTEQFTCIGQDASKVWLGSVSGALYFFDKASKTFSSKKIAASKINAVSLSRNNNTLYAITAANELITLNTFNNQVSNSIVPVAEPFSSIYEDKSGQLWLQPQNHGTVKYNPIDKSFKHFFQKGKAVTVETSYDIFEDNENRVWIRIKGAGLGYYNAETNAMEYFDKDPNAADHLLSSIVTCKYYDPTGVLWVSTVNRGIEKIVFQRNDFAPKYFVENAANKLENEVRGMCNDSRNRVWIAAKSGKLYIQDYEGRRLSNVFVNEPVGGIGSVYSIMQQRNGIIWLGTKGNGLFKAEPVDAANTKYRLTHFLSNKNDANSLSSDLIYSLVEDRQGRIWIGTFENGINMLDEKSGKAQFINIKNGFKNYPINIAKKVRCLQLDEAGNLWIATTNGLIVSNITNANLSELQFQLYRKTAGDKQSLGNNDVQFVFRDSKNRMWVATSGGGLNNATGNIQNGLKFKAFTKDDGMPSNYVLGIAEDNSGNLWLSTENGLAKFNTDNHQFRNYDSYDGLPQTVFSESAVLKLSNGNILIGCISGYLIFSPEKITYQKIKAALAFTNFQVNNKDVFPSSKESPLQLDINNTKEVQLQHDQNVISIDFTVLDYRSNTKQAYAYRLVGFDDKWNNVVDEHKATYTNLPPGDYTFEVKNLSPELHTEEPFKKLHIVIRPPFWRTWWTYLIYFVLLIVVVEIVRRTLSTMIRLRNRISVEQRLTELKLNFFTNISHELRTPLTLIANPVDEVLQKENLSIKGQEHLGLARKNINRMIRFINQLLDFRKMQSGKMNLKVEQVEIVSFVKEVASHFAEAAVEKNIELLVTSNVNELFAWIDADKMDIVVYNLLSNAFKFSANGKVIVVNVSSINSHRFTIEVTDQGIGVPQDKLDDIFELYYEIDKVQNKHHAGTGIGLALSKEVVLLHHGKIAAYNNPSGGLTVKMELKAGKEHFTGQDFDNASLSEDPLQQIGGTNEVVVAPKQSNDEATPLVLIVDDNQELRNYLADLLAEHYRIVQAVDGKDGWEKAVELIPDLVLSDVMMPEMDGIQLLDKLKNDVSTSHIPVILLTAKSSIESQVQGLSYGADYYITKPFNTNFIIASIENLIKQRKKIFDSLLYRKMPLKPLAEEAKQPPIEEGPSNQPSDQPAIVITAKDEEFLNRVIEIIEAEMQNPDFNVDKVAELMLMGRTTFFKKFKSLTNIAPVEFIRDTRLRRAKEMLDAGEDNIATLAFQAGFSSTKYFSACFKEKYGMLPTKYLKETA